MFSIKRALFGYDIVFTDTTTSEEMKKWVKESKRILKKYPDKFNYKVEGI